MKKNPAWTAKWKARANKRKANGKKVFGRLFASKQGNKKGKPFMPNAVSQKEKQIRRENRKKARGSNDNTFRDEVINRDGGSMWGGHRNDGQDDSVWGDGRRRNPFK